MWLDGGVVGWWVLFGQQVLFGRRASFQCCAPFGSSGGVWVCLDVVWMLYGGCWVLLVGCWGWLVVVVKCADRVTLCDTVVILLLWEFTLVSNKVNKCTIEFIGSVAELLSLLFCASGDPEVEGSIPHVHII